MRIIVALVCFIYAIQTSAQQVQLTYQQAQNGLLESGAQLLAQWYTISAAQAEAVQAMIWDAPVVSGEINAYNPDRKKTFDAGTNGQKSFAIEQLFVLGGKRGLQSEAASVNTEVAVLQYEQLLRNLRYQIAQNFFGLYYDLRNIATLEAQLVRLDTLLSYYSTQADKGNIPLKEVVRLQSLMLQLQIERNDVLKNVLDEQQTLKLLTGYSEDILPVVVDAELESRMVHGGFLKDTVLSTALKNNIDFRIVQKQSEYQQKVVQWQKSLAIPDITAGLSYDQRGGAFNNQVNLLLSIPIPLWNTKSGDIQKAEAQYQQAAQTVRFKELELNTAVSKAVQLHQLLRQQQQNLSPDVINKLEIVYQGMLENFQMRNVSLLEFTDFMESYNTTVVHYNEMQKRRLQATLDVYQLMGMENF